MPIVCSHRVLARSHRLRPPCAPRHDQPEDTQLMHRTRFGRRKAYALDREPARESAGAAGGEVVAWCSAPRGGRLRRSRGGRPRLAVSCSKGGSSGRQRPGQTLGRVTSRAGRRRSSKSASGFSGADWNDPTCFKVGAQYWMYASSNLGFAPTRLRRSRSTASPRKRRMSWTLDPIAPVLTVTNGQWDQGRRDGGRVLRRQVPHVLDRLSRCLAQTSMRPISASATPLRRRIAWTKDARSLLGPGASGASTSHRGRTGPGGVQQHLYLYSLRWGSTLPLVPPAGLQVVGVMSPPTVSPERAGAGVQPDQTGIPRFELGGYSTPNAS